jgi:hypothetical protein
MFQCNAIFSKVSILTTTKIKKKRKEREKEDFSQCFNVNPGSLKVIIQKCGLIQGIKHQNASSLKLVHWHMISQMLPLS